MTGKTTTREARGKFHHEAVYRGDDQIARIAEQQITICGVGALGSNLADNLARQGFRHLRAIDDDRIEEHNVGTQVYGQSEIGSFKVEALRQRLFRTAGIEIETWRKRLEEKTIKQLLKGSSLIVDCFDNSESRQLLYRYGEKSSLLHVGLYADYGEVVWNHEYKVPMDVAGDVCNYPLARNLILLTVAVASEIIVRYVLKNEQSSFTITLRDFAVRPLRG